MLKTIVWAADGSENAERALPYARALMDGDDALLVAVHIVERSAGKAPAHGIAAVAREVSADAIVAGTCHSSKPARLT